MSFIVDKNKNNVIVPCSAWDYEGDSEFIRDKCSRTFFEDIKLKYPQIDLPIQVGWTGYIDFQSDDKSYNGWTYDLLDRFVAQINGYRVFQRYQNGDVLMYEKPECYGWSLLHRDVMPTLLIKNN